MTFILVLPHTTIDVRGPSLASRDGASRAEASRAFPAGPRLLL
jgi:hypothetical protein